MGTTITPTLRARRLRFTAFCVGAAFLLTLLSACSDDDAAQASKDPDVGVIGSWSGPSVANDPTPQATAVILADARPAVVEATGSEIHVLEPDTEQLTIRASQDLGAPVVWMQPRVDGESLRVLAQTCPSPLSTVGSVDRDCPSSRTVLVTFEGSDLDTIVDDVDVDGVARDFAALSDRAAITTTAGFFVGSPEGGWKLTVDVTGASCATDEAYVERSVAGSTPTTIGGTGSVPGESFTVKSLDGGAAADPSVPGHIGSLTCGPDGYVVSVSSSSDPGGGASFWAAPGVGTPKELAGPAHAMPLIEGQLSRGQWAKTTVGTRRTAFVDPTTGDWFAATGLKGSGTPPYATRSDDHGLVFAPAPGGGSWTLHAYELAR